MAYPATGGMELKPPQPPQEVDPFAAMGGGVKVNGGWVPKSHPLAGQQPAAPTPTTAPPLTSAPATAPPEARPTAAPGQTSQTPVQQGPQQTIQGSYAQALNKMLATNPVVNSVQDDPALAAQSGAFRQAAARSEQRQRNAAAERANATGTLESGGFDSTVQQLGADRGFQEAQYDAQLLGGARQQRMAELQQALVLAGNQLSEDERNQIQMELVELQRQQQADATRLGERELGIREQGISAQNELGRGDLDLRRYLGSGQLGLGLLSTLLNDRQTNTGQAISLAGLGQGANQNALLALLNGLG